MAEAHVPVRVLPSGKVYRQMFDAEVQLVNSLQALKPNPARLPPLRTPEQSRPPGNMLTERQKSWAVGMPNDYFTENPVKYRQLTAESAVCLSQDQPNEHVAEVLKLPNDVQKTNRNSMIIEKISSRRQERHYVEVEKMHDELSTISSRIEPLIMAVGKTLKDRLKSDDTEIEKIFGEVSEDGNLVVFSMALLDDIWKRVDDHSKTRLTWIEEADEKYSQIENERFDAMTGVFRRYAAVLEKIAFLMPVDVQRYIEKESMMANQGILANRRAYAKLRINLIESEIQRKMTCHLTWKERLEKWKKLNIEIAVESFKEFMTGDEICNPPEVQEHSDHFLDEQKLLEEKRRDLLEQLVEFKPPSSTKTSVYKWNSALTKAQENIDQLNLKWLRSVNEKYEKVCQTCLSEMDKYRKNLIDSKVCTEEEIQVIVSEQMLPLVGERQRSFETQLDEMDQMFESLALRTETQLKGLFRFLQGAAHLWDVHELGLAKEGRNLQNMLDESRQVHDIDNQDRETELDKVLDCLRQESTEEDLKSSLQKSLEKLKVIYSGYLEFHKQQLNFVNKYPKMIQSQMKNYDKAVCKFFNVDRKMPDDAESAQTPEPPVESSVSPGLKKKFEILHDIVKTSSGTTFYVVTSLNKEDLEDEIEQAALNDETDGRKSSAMSGNLFLTEISDSGEKKLSKLVERTYLTSGDLLRYRKEIRLQFLNHLEVWTKQVIEKAENSTRDKCEELASELDLRQHLHEPRAKRIEVDVHNVRAAELVLHRERVSRHCKGITAALLDLKESFQKMTEEHDGLAVGFKEKIEGMESVFVNSTKTSKLVELTNSLHEKLDLYMQVIKASLRQFRQRLDGTLSRLRDSNAQCLKSFKLFSQGGNFSPDETKVLRQKLEKMSGKVDIAEGLIMQDLEGMESRRLDHGTEIVMKFEERFRNHMIDLTFIEKVQRWITNSQVRIKTEVQHCNGMGANIARHVKSVKSRIDACKFPNPDKEEISTSFLCEYAEEVMKCLKDRVDYLNCRLQLSDSTHHTASAPDMLERSNSEKPLSRQGPASNPVSRQGFGSNPASRQALNSNPVSRQRGRSNTLSKLPVPKSNTQTPLARTDMQTGGSTRKGQPQEDTAIGMIKSILRNQKGLDHEVDDNHSILTSGKRQLLSTSASHGRPSRGLKGAKRRGTLGSIASGSEKSRKDSESRGNSSIYKRRDTKFELRHMVFGTNLPTGTSFESKINAILYETLDGLLSIGELYYKQKGSRPVTRPKHIQDSFDQFSDVVVAKLLNYDNQTKEFHNMALQEFRQQLNELEESLAEIPKLVLNEILKNSLENLKKEQELIKADFAKKEGEWVEIKNEHKNTLRPTLGHPNQQNILDNLIKKEEVRQQENIAGIQQNASDLTKNAYDITKAFLLSLSQACVNLLFKFDQLLTIDDVYSGKIEVKLEPTSILLRKKAAGIDLHDTSYKPTMLRGPKVWPGLDLSDFSWSHDDISEVTEDINCGKTTLSHLSSIKYRDECLFKFMQAYKSLIAEIYREEKLQLDSVNRWTDNWFQSVKNVRELYRT